jgi:hypothetical protein
MKTISRKLLQLKLSLLVRNISLSLACIGLVAVMLYILINSPA